MNHVVVVMSSAAVWSMADQRPASLYVGHDITPMERFPTRRAEPEDPKPAEVAGETVRTTLCRSERLE